MGQPVTFHVGPGAEPPGGPESWGGSKVGIGWRQGVGGRETTELLSNTWGAESGGTFGGGAQGGQWRCWLRLRRHRKGGLGWHWDPSVTPWPLTAVTGHSALPWVSPPEAPGVQGLRPRREGAEHPESETFKDGGLRAQGGSQGSWGWFTKTEIKNLARQVCSVVEH